jgi:prevent-host-death family protein
MTTGPENHPSAAAGVPTVALADARAELSKLVTLAEHTGRITAITRYGRPVAAIVPAAHLHLLSGANIGPRPMEAAEIDRIADRANAASRKPSSDDIRAALDDVRAEGEPSPSQQTASVIEEAARQLDKEADRPLSGQLIYEGRNPVADLLQFLNAPLVELVGEQIGAAAAEKLRATAGRDVTVGALLATWSATHGREATE